MYYFFFILANLYYFFLQIPRIFSRALRVGANLIRVQSVRSVAPIRLLKLIPKVFIVLVFLGLFG